MLSNWVRKIKNILQNNFHQPFLRVCVGFGSLCVKQVRQIRRNGTRSVQRHAPLTLKPCCYCKSISPTEPLANRVTTVRVSVPFAVQSKIFKKFSISSVLNSSKQSKILLCLMHLYAKIGRYDRIERSSHIPGVWPITYIT